MVKRQRAVASPPSYSNRSNLGHLLRRYRQASGLTQEQLAERSGVSVRAIGNLERGVEHTPRRATVELLAEALHLSVPERATWQVAASRACGPTGRARAGDGATLPIAMVRPTYPLPAHGPFVGREDALRAALASLPRLGSSGRARLDLPRLLLVAGEAGIGKTRFLAEIARWGQERGLLVLAGGCYEAEGRLPLSVLHDALLDYVEAQPDEVLRVQLEGLVPGLARVVPELRDRFPDLPEARTEDPEGQRLRLFWTMARAFERVSEAQPLLLLLDDLQWADETTLQLVHFLMRQPQLEQLLIVGAYRRGDRRETAVVGRLLIEGVRHIVLRPLGPDDLATVLSSHLGGTCAPRLAREIHDRSGGNPFFGLEIVGLLQQEGWLERGRTETGVAWHRRGGADLDLPPAVRETVARRLEQLEPGAVEVLQLAGVTGRRVAYATLREVWEGGERALLRALDAALSAQILEETEVGFAFRHPVIREVVYRQLSAARRAWLHARVAQAIEAVSGERAGEHAAELAHHLVAGGVRGARALHYLILAAAAAARASAWEEALDLYRAALEHAEADRPVAEVHEQIGGVLKVLGRYDEALAALGAAAERYQREGDLRRAGEATAAMVQVHALRGTWEQGRALARPILGQLERLGATTGDPARTLADLSLALTYLYDAGPEESLHAAERAAQLARAVRDDGLLARAEMRRGLCLFALRRLPDAQRVIEALIPLAEAAADSSTLRFAVSVLSDIHKLGGRFELCLRCREQALAYAERRADEPHWIMVDLAQLGEALFLLGDWPGARSRHERAMAMTRASPAPHYTAFVLLGLGTLELAEGRWAEASRHIEACLAEAQSTGDSHWVRNTQRLLAYRDLLLGRPDEALRRLAQDGHPGELYLRAWAQLESGDVPQAGATIERTLRLAREQDNRLDLCEARIVHSRICAQQGRPAEAGHAIDEALLLARAMPFPYAEARALYDGGILAGRRGDVQFARTRLSEARAIFQQLGAQPYLDRTEQALARIDSSLREGAGTL